MARLPYSWLALSALALHAAGCSRRGDAPPEPRAQLPASAPSAGEPPPEQPAALAAAEQPAFRWFHDAPQPAFEAALKERKLVFADLWAPWCHTCLSMQAEVLVPGVVPGLDEQVVLLAVDTEREENAAFLQEFPVAVWPTFYLIDPRTRGVRGRWLGAATAPQLRAFVADAALSEPGSTALARLREGDALAAKSDPAGAARKYREALAAAPPDWGRRADVLVSLVVALARAGDYAGCLELAVAVGDTLPASVSASDFSSTTLSCAERAPRDPRVERARKLAQVRLRAVCEGGAAGLSADDQADACAGLRRARSALGDDAGARSAAERGLSVISAASAGKPHQLQLIHDWARTDALMFLGRAEEAERLLQQREAGAPESYNPPHYLARLYRDTQRWSEGLSAIERALGKAYGARRVGLLGVKVDLLRGAGRVDEARRLLEAQLAAYRALPEGQKQPNGEAAVARRLAEWK